MRIQMLGPLRVWDGTRWAGINAPHHRIVLSVLLAEAGRTVPRDRLINDIWGERPTRTAGAAVNGYVMRLRRLLKAGAAADLVTHAAGYELVTGEDTVDAKSFERLLDAAKVCVSQGRLADAADNLGTGLALWRGPALADVPSTLIVSAEVARLEQLRLAAWEQHLAAQLEVGQHAAIVDELESLVREHPLRERLCSYLMIALYRCGRRAEALEAYRRVRSVLVDETGLEPGPQLRDLELAVLNDDPVLAAPRFHHVTPAQLPAAATHFTGRNSQLDTLSSVALQGNPAIVAISGLAGVGKTALAVHWAHRAIKDDFPDGQLYVDLRGYSDRPPVTPMEALANFLQALGVDPQRIPREVEEAAGLYRSLLAGKRILVVLDNAAHPDRVRPLLPGGPGCAVLITSRDLLRGLTAREGAVSIRLDVLRPDEAHDLLRTLLPGHDRREPDGDNQSTAELARLCGYLPLAIRIAVANLRAELTPIETFNKRLAAGDRLAALGIDGDAMAATANAFGLSYRTHSPAAQRLFRLLAIAPGDASGKPAAAALAGLPVADTEQLLETLATAHLIEPVAPGRYGFHDLVRLYARQLCLQHDADRDEALCRLYDHYLSTVDAVVRILYPHVVRLKVPETHGQNVFAAPEDALRWVETERDNMVAAVLAAGPAQGEAAWRLTDCLRWHLDFTAPSMDWLPVTESALAHARQSGGPLGQAAAFLFHATVLWGNNRYPEAIESLNSARALARDGGWPEGESCALSNLSAVHYETGCLDKAAAHTLAALEIDLRLGRDVGQLLRLTNLAHIRICQGRLDDAVTHCLSSIEIERRVGHWHGIGQAHACLGEAYHLLGRDGDALSCLKEALTTHRRTGARGYEADTLRVLSLCGTPEARTFAAQSLRLAREIGDHWIEAQALIAQATLDLQDGDHTLAIGTLSKALALARCDGARHAEAQALIALSRAHLSIGANADAESYAKEALAISDSSGYHLLTKLCKEQLEHHRVCARDFPVARP